MTSRWLWITSEITDRLDTGGLVYSMELARSIADLGVAVTMVGLAPSDVSSAPASSGGETLRYEAVPGRPRSKIRGLGSSLPNQAFTCATRELERRVGELLREEWDVVVFDSIRSGWATRQREQHPAGLTVFVTQNHEASFRRELVTSAPIWSARRWLLAIDTWKVVRLERRMLRISDLVTAITDADLRQFARDAPRAQHLNVPPGWNGQVSSSTSRISDRPRRVGIVGSLEWHVKQENLRRFLAVADPIFAREGIELVIGGRVPDRLRSELEPSLSAARFVGWVDDVGDFIGQCRLGVVAEALGGGFKMKALDYVFNGVPVASLSHCAAGLPLVGGVSMVEAPDEASLAAAIVEVIDDTALLESFAEVALEQSLPLFTWSGSAQRLVAASDELREELV